MKKICRYCNEFPANTEIDNPNIEDWKDEPFWEVCPTCAKLIPLQKKQTMAIILKSISKKHGFDSSNLDEKINKLNKEINELTYEADLKPYSILIKKDGKCGVREK